MKFRSLRADEVECRIGTVSKNGNGLSLLLYKDARCDMNILDEAVGPLGWQKEFYEHKGTLFCRVGIRNAEEWVWKTDAGAPSNMEAAKGEASDAFKRACVNWGIGRELYTAPFIWVPVRHCSIKDGKCYDKFSVTELDVAGGRIARLEVAKDGYGTVFTWGSKPARDMSAITELKKRYAKAKGLDEDVAAAEIVGRFGNPRDMTDAEFSAFAHDLTAEVSGMEAQHD